MTHPVRHVWFVVFPESELLDLAGPWAVLGYTNEVMGKRVYATYLVTAVTGEIRTRHGLALSGARSLRRAAALGLPDTLVVAGGAPDKLPEAEARMVRWLRPIARGPAGGDVRAAYWRMRVCSIGAGPRGIRQYVQLASAPIAERADHGRRNFPAGRSHLDVGRHHRWNRLDARAR